MAEITVVQSVNTQEGALQDVLVFKNAAEMALVASWLLDQGIRVVGFPELNMLAIDHSQEES